MRQRNKEPVNRWYRNPLGNSYFRDRAFCCVYLMENYDSPEIVNIGTGKDISIGEMAMMIKKITGYEGDIVFDTSMPDGTFRKLLDVSRLHSTGWQPAIGFEDGVRNTYKEKFEIHSL